MRMQANAPYMRSSAADGEHSGPVWAVRWQPSAAAGTRSLVLVSISSDGRLVEWALGKAKFTHEVKCQGFGSGIKASPQPSYKLSPTL